MSTVGDGAGSDTAWMEQALALARLGEATTAPNPRVGCVVVREGVAVGWGWHRAAGAEHAEAVALERAGSAARGATLYVSLEPCAHHGRTPPCVSRVIAAGVRRVVAAVQDPDPRVDGRGFAALRRAGIEVDVGVLESQARWINRDFFHWHATGRPWVTLKGAVSLDGMVAGRGGESKWVTGEPARRWVHRVRLRHDAVLVGAETLRRDDPRLTVRLPGAERAPLRVVLSRTLALPSGARLFREGGPVRIYTVSGAPAERQRALEARGAEVRCLPPAGEGVDLAALLEDLGRAGVQSLLVEGGGRTWAAFLGAGLAQEIVLCRAPKLIGAGGATPLFPAQAASLGNGATTWIRWAAWPLGGDDIWCGRLRHGQGGTGD